VVNEAWMMMRRELMMVVGVKRKEGSFPFPSMHDDDSGSK